MSTIPEPHDNPDVPQALGGLLAAAHAVGLQDHKRLLDWKARTVEESWRMGTSALGWQPETTQDEDDEMGGNVSVMGDTHIHVVPQDRQEQMNPDKPDPQPQPTASTPWLPWLLAAGLAAGNIAGGAWLINNLPQANNDSRTTVGLETE